MADSNRMSSDELARRAITPRDSRVEGRGLLDARCPECSDKLREHKDAPCIHTWILNLQAQMHYVECGREFWKRQYHNRQIEDASGYREALVAILCNSESNVTKSRIVAAKALMRTCSMENSDETKEGNQDCPVCKGRGWYESWNDCICGQCCEYETVMCRCHAKYVGRKD